MRGIERLHALVELLLKSALPGDAARMTLGPMLVVGHKQHEIDEIGVGRVRPAIVIKRNGEHDGIVVRGKGDIQFGEEGLQVLLGPRWYLLEVHGHSLELVFAKEVHDLRDTRRPAPWDRSRTWPVLCRPIPLPPHSGS